VENYDQDEKKRFKKGFYVGNCHKKRARFLWKKGSRIF
jgi:hypothetical protein